MPAGQSLPLPIGDRGAAEAVVLLAVTTNREAGSEQQQKQLLLKSQPFSLDSDSSEASSDSSRSMHLLLAHEPPAPAAAAARGLASFWGGGSSTPAEASSSSSRGRVECRLAARVQVQEHPAANGAAAAAAVSVTITAGCFVSNLSGLLLAMLAEGAAADSVMAAFQAGSTQLEQQPQALSPENSSSSLPSPRSPPSASSARQGVRLPHASTLPLLHLWQADGSSGRQHRRRHQRQGSWGSFTGGLLPSPSTQQLHVAAAGAAAAGGPAVRFAIAAAATAAPTGDEELPTPQPRLQQELQAAPAAPDLGRWSAALPPFAPAGRQRLYLQQPNAAGGASAGVVMLTYRVLLTGGSFHLVLFRCAELSLPGIPPPAEACGFSALTSWWLPMMTRQRLTVNSRLMHAHCITAAATTAAAGTASRRLWCATRRGRRSMLDTSLPPRLATEALPMAHPAPRCGQVAVVFCTPPVVPANGSAFPHLSRTVFLL
jgi:hypothetical protein